MEGDAVPFLYFNESFWHSVWMKKKGYCKILTVKRLYKAFSFQKNFMFANVLNVFIEGSLDNLPAHAVEVLNPKAL